jgi:DNA-binding Lrp family transcriptional regulator
MQVSPAFNPEATVESRKIGAGLGPPASISFCARSWRRRIVLRGQIRRRSAPFLLEKRSCRRSAAFSTATGGHACQPFWGFAMKLDRIDIKILHELQKNGRVTNVELAELVNLSPSPCLMRVKKLQTEGYIEGYSAQISIAKLGQTLTVFTEVTLKNHRQIDFARFLAAVEKVDQVIECHLVSGGYDYMMKFVTAGIGEYQTIMERLTDMDIGIEKYFSFVVLKSPIVKPYLPLTSLFQM